MRKLLNEDLFRRNNAVWTDSTGSEIGLIFMVSTNNRYGEYCNCQILGLKINSTAGKIPKKRCIKKSCVYNSTGFR